MIVLTLILSYVRKRDVEQGGGDAVVTREFLSANVTLYGTLAVGILYFWNWLNDLSPAFTAIGGDVITTTWTIVGVALLPLSAAVGVYMVKSDNQSGSHAGSTHSHSGATATHPAAVADYSLPG